ncbi:MAG TPA: hypothetical protein VGK76_03535 [Candidatus Eisenbacteria bacterium]|jgi:hypothetical protein
MTVCAWGGLTILLLSLIRGAPCSGECERGSGSFESDIEWADLIFAGTFDRSEVVKGLGTIITRHHFSQVHYIKGTGPKDELVLAQGSGQIGDEETTAEDALDFRQGRRYVAYAHKGEGKDTAAHLALYACVVNPFGIWAEKPSGPQVVHVGNGSALLALRDRYLLVLRDQSWESAHPPSGYAIFGRPPKRSLAEELRTADSTYAADRERQDPPGGVRLFALWPHQDPGTRVTEGPFVDWLARVCKRVTAAADSGKAR